MQLPKLITLLVSAFLTSVISEGAQFKSVVVRTGDTPDSVEANAARILVERISGPGGLAVRVERESQAKPAGRDALLILLGVQSSHKGIARLMERERMWTDPEGFVLKTFAQPEGPVLVAVGIDTHGVLFAVGEILRRADVRQDGLEFPIPFETRAAPAFEVRGTQFGQSRVAFEKGKVRRWTAKELQRKIEDYTLAGANTFEYRALSYDDETYRFLRSMGLKVLVHYTANAGSGPAEWAAKESYGRTGYLCPSIPAARQALLDKCDATFRNSAPVDYVRFSGGDGGGCECDRCRPYGGTFMRLTEELAAVVHRYHPKAQIFVTNQKFDNEGDLAIFSYLREKPRPWLRAFCYGPGSDAMAWFPGYRQNYRMDLFRYPGFGPFDRYLKEILHQLPPQQDLVFFNELTHTRGSQYGYASAYPRADTNGDLPPHWNHWLYERRMDPVLAMVYDRLTFFAWPRHYRWVFGETVRYGIGDVTHSSGTQDHFNQWMWQRLMWGPHRTAEDVVAEYARAWFGPEAAQPMEEALFQFEKNFELDPKVPLTEKTGIDRYYNLVKQAGERMPIIRMKENWLWREHMQRAALDKFIQLDLHEQLALRGRIERRIAQALKQPAASAAAIDEALAWLAQPRGTAEMQRYRAEAVRLGEESNQLYGVRSDALSSLDHDFVGFGWLKRQLERAKVTSGEKRTEMLEMIADYENPGEGGFYDDAGSFEGAPHIVNGQPYSFSAIAEGNRPSQRTLHFTQESDQGVTLRYEGLDHDAAYRIRFTFVRPPYQDRHAHLMKQTTQSVYAEQFILAKDLEIPKAMSDYFTFDIPREATCDGVLTIRLEKSPVIKFGTRVDREIWRNTDGWGTILSEAWLMKKRPAGQQ